MKLTTKFGAVILAVPLLVSQNPFSLQKNNVFATSVEETKIVEQSDMFLEKPQFAFDFYNEIMKKFIEKIIKELEESKEIKTEIVEEKVSLVDERNNHIKQDVFVNDKVEIHHDEFRPSVEYINRLEQIIKQYPKDISFYVSSLDNQISFGYNPDQKYSAASSIKAPYTLFCYKQIQEGKATLEEKITYNKKYYSSGSGIIKNNPKKSYTIEELLYNVIYYSDNIAYAMLDERFGVEEYKEMLDEIGCEYLKVTKYSEWGFASPKEMALIWNEIYYYKDTELGAKFFNDLLNAKYDFVKQSLNGYDVAHKSGWSQRGYNDHAIVFSDVPYFISIMIPYPEDSEKYQQVFKSIAQICDQIMNEYSLSLQDNKILVKK